MPTRKCALDLISRCWIIECGWTAAGRHPTTPAPEGVPRTNLAAASAIHRRAAGSGWRTGVHCGRDEQAAQETVARFTRQRPRREVLSESWMREICFFHNNAGSLPAGTTSVPGQTEKHSARADVFRSSSKNGRWLSTTPRFLFRTSDVMEKIGQWPRHRQWRPRLKSDRSAVHPRLRADLATKAAHSSSLETRLVFSSNDHLSRHG